MKHDQVLDLEPRVDAHYRGHKLAVWNNLVINFKTILNTVLITFTTMVTTTTTTHNQVPGLLESSQPPQHPPHSPPFNHFTTTSAPERR